jgi:hypothetical protein
VANQFSKRIWIALGLILGFLFFLLDSRDSYQTKFDEVQIGMEHSRALVLLRDQHETLCSAEFDHSARSCWFRDSKRVYRIDFDATTGIVVAKGSRLRVPRSLVDRFIAWAFK